VRAHEGDLSQRCDNAESRETQSRPFVISRSRVQLPPLVPLGIAQFHTTVSPGCVWHDPRQRRSSKQQRRRVTRSFTANVPRERVDALKQTLAHHGQIQRQLS
jgi:hypothetical protein